MSLDAGSLNKRVRLQRNAAVKNAFGHKSAEGWDDVATLWADVRQVGAQEKVVADAKRPVATHTVAIRYNPFLMPTSVVSAMRLVWQTPIGDRVLDIQTATDLKERHEWIIFECVEVANG